MKARHTFVYKSWGLSQYVLALGVLTSVLLLAFNMPAAAQTGADLIVDSDGAASSTDCTGTGFANVETTIQNAVDNASSGNTIFVCPGTYAENVVVGKSITLQGPTSGTATVDATGGTGEGIVVTAPGVTVDNFEIQATTFGIAARNIATTSSDGLTITNNTLTFPNGQEFDADNSGTAGDASGEQAVGIQLSGISGPTAPVIEDNVIGNTSTPSNGAFYGYALFDVQADAPAEIRQTGALTGPSINGVMQGIFVANTDFSTSAGSSVEVDGLVMDNFTGESPNDAVNFHAGVFIFTSPNAPNPVTTTISDVTVRNTGTAGGTDAPPDGCSDASPENASNCGGQASAGLYFGDFGADDGNTRQDITVERATLDGNDNRGIFLRGPGATATVTDSELTGNGDAPFTAGGNNGYSAIARENGSLTIETSLITGPGSVTTSGSPDDNDLVQISAGGNVTVTRSRLDRNGIGDYITTSGGGDLDASGNAFADGENLVDPRTASGIANGADFSPFIIPPNTDDGDPSTIGFQGDFSSLVIDNGSPQTGTETREAEALDLLAGPEESQRLFVFQTGTNVYEELTVNDRTILIVPGESGGPLRVTDLTYDGEPGGSGSNLPNLEVEDITINDGSFPFTEGSTPTITVVNGEVVVDPSVTGISNSPTFELQNRFVGNQSGGNGNNAGWRLLTSPRKGTTAALLEDLQQANTGNILVLWDDETQEFDYSNSVDGTTSLPRGESFFVYLFDLDNPIGAAASDTCTPDDACIRTSGPLNVGDAPTGGFGTNTVTVDVSDTENTSSTEAGYLLGNPFAQSFDIANLTVQSTGNPIGTDGIFEGAVTVYNPLTDEFTPVNADTNLDSEVAPWQGFWLLRQPSEDPLQEETLVYDEAGRTQGAPFVPAKSTMASFNSGQLFVTLGIEQDAEVVQQSRASIYAREGASTDRDAYDLARIQPMSETFAQVSFLRSNGTRASQYSVPYGLEGSVDIPLHAEGVGVSGTAHISTEGWANIPNDWELTLTDTQTGETTPLVPGESYTFSLNESDPQPTAQPGMQSGGGEANPRFVVTAGPPEPLPVELAQFTGRADGTSAVLAWETASETNNAGFRVQQQTNSDTYETVQFVEGAGTTDTPQSYQIRVDDLDYGMHSFRIEQVDTDGTATPSDPVEVQVRLQEAMALSPVAPNPVQGQSTITMTVRETQPVQAALYDALGRRVRTLYDGELSGQQPQTLTIDASSLASGTYFVRIRSESSVQTTRLVVVR